MIMHVYTLYCRSEVHTMQLVCFSWCGWGGPYPCDSSVCAIDKGEGGAATGSARSGQTLMRDQSQKMLNWVTKARRAMAARHRSRVVRNRLRNHGRKLNLRQGLCNFREPRTVLGQLHTRTRRC
jgi:hypothetical protein